MDNKRTWVRELLFFFLCAAPRALKSKGKKKKKSETKEMLTGCDKEKIEGFGLRNHLYRWRKLGKEHVWVKFKMQNQVGCWFSITEISL